MSKLGLDGVQIQRTQLGNIALVIPTVYLDQPDPSGMTFALILSRADALELARMLDAAAQEGQS